MAKVFRLHQGANGTGWFISQSLTPAQLTTIKTEGKDAATSIPSPFARIDLVKTAFRWVTHQGIEGTTAHHRLVSDTLDVAQMFYLSGKHRDKVEIVAYNPAARFKTIIEQGELTRHNRFAETLKLFWEQDSVSPEETGNLVLYNFEHVRRLYLLIRKSTQQVIGGTSPATLFFPAPDAHEVASSLRIKSSEDELFNNEYSSLTHREPSFIRYLYALSKQSNFALYFPEFYAYLEKVRLSHLVRDLVSVVTNLDAQALQDYDPCLVKNNPGDCCEVLGIPLGIQLKDHEERGINESSDFTIQADFSFPGRKPLVLPFGRFTGKWTYTTPGILWNENNEVPFRNERSFEDSKLPIQEDAYPWLTIGNFLEDKIIELPYSVDHSRFNLCGATRHLLPLTPLFLKYFKAENADKMLNLRELAGGGVEAVLEIPVKKGKIHYKKIYSQPDKEKPEVHLAIIPFVRSEKHNFPYTVGIIDDRTANQRDFTIACFEKGERISSDDPVFRNHGKVQKSYYFKTGGHFDMLRLVSENTGGFLLPLWKTTEGSYNEIHFAIDFGTTNTHIEYKYGNYDAIPLDNVPNLPIWQSLLKYGDSSNNPQDIADDKMFEKEIMPYVLSSSEEGLTHFPLRTALAFNKQMDPNSPMESFRHCNAYMLFEKIHVPIYLDIRTQLKWSNYADVRDKSLIESYIEFLLRVVYYKTLLLGGDPEKTTITWFYPVSMDGYELGVLFRTWENVYKSIFRLNPDENRIHGIPESIAPYLYYKSSVIGNSLSVDIGGGSTDLAVFDEETPNAKIISSFKFAGNAIFGDGFPSSEYRNNSDRNGFVRHFAGPAREAVRGDTFLQPILDNILNKTKDSGDFSSLLFAMEANSRNTFSYTRLLESHKRMKLPILLFYGAIAYYSAHLLKKCGLETPGSVLLSGTAAKTAAIVDPTPRFLNLAGMFRYIFEKTWLCPVTVPEVILSPIPKEITCKGALKVGIKESITQNSIKFWIGGSGQEIWSRPLDKTADIHLTPKYGDIDHRGQLSIRDSILDFFRILDGYTGTINLEGTYNIELKAYEIFRRMREENILEYLKRGMKAFYKDDEKHIEETLFFYPLIGLLNKLSFELSEY